MPASWLYIPAVRAYVIEQLRALEMAARGAASQRALALRVRACTHVAAPIAYGVVITKLGRRRAVNHNVANMIPIARRPHPSPAPR